MFWAAFSGAGRRTGLRGGVNRWEIVELYQRV